MPYTTRQVSEGVWAVVKKDNGKVLGKHGSKASAQRQIRAIYANEGRQSNRKGK